MSLGNTVFNTLSKRELKTLLCAVPLVFAGYAHAVPDGGIVSQENLTLEVIEKPQDQEYPLTSAVPEVEQEPVNPVKVAVNKIVFKGATVIAVEALDAEVSDALGEEHSFVGLKRLAAQILGLYREKGYLMAQVYLPEQNLKSGTLQINISEGLLDQVNIAQTGKLKSVVTQRYIDSLPKNKVLNSTNIERTLRLLSDLPSNEVRFVFDPSLKEGDADINNSLGYGDILRQCDQQHQHQPL